MSKSLFNEYYAHTEDGKTLSEGAYSDIHRLFARYVELGYSPREIAAIVFGTVSVVESNFAIEHAMELRQQKREMGR